jgi:hypothetical protein
MHPAAVAQAASNTATPFLVDPDAARRVRCGSRDQLDQRTVVGRADRQPEVATADQARILRQGLKCEREATPGNNGCQSPWDDFGGGFGSSSQRAQFLDAVHHSTSPRSAGTTSRSWALELMPSFGKMRYRCELTVLCEM